MGGPKNRGSTLNIVAFYGEIPSKWMMTGGTPIYRTPHIYYMYISPFYPLVNTVDGCEILHQLIGDLSHYL